jgi:hypothetical protein
MRHHGWWPQSSGECHDGKVPDPMTDVVAARDAYQAARREVTERRLALGRAILDARQQNVAMGKIAETLNLTREQVRRYRFEYEKSLKAS